MLMVHFIIEIQNFKNFKLRDLNLEVYRKENYRNSQYPNSSITWFPTT